MADVTIVIPAYNEEKYVAQAIESVCAQSYEDWELIVIDDGSKDATADIARRYVSRDSRIRLVQQPNSGLAAARNRGFIEASKTSSFFNFLDSDDKLEVDAISSLRSVLLNDTNAILAYGFASFIDERDALIFPGFLPESFVRRRRLVGGAIVFTPWDEPTSFEQLIYENCIRTPGAALIPRSTLDNLGLFDGTSTGVEDWDFWIRASLLGSIAAFPGVVLRYRVRESSMSTNRPLMLSGEIRLRRKMMLCTELSESRRKLAFAVYHHHFTVHTHHLVEVHTYLAQCLASGMTQPFATVQPEGYVKEAREAAKRELVLIDSLMDDPATAIFLLQNVGSTTPSRQLSRTDIEAVKRALERLNRQEMEKRWRDAKGLLRQGKPIPAIRNLFRIVALALRHINARKPA